MSALLEVEQLTTDFHLRHANVRAVDDVSFSVEAGECVGLVGESGCGKSTTGLSVMQLLPNVGHVTSGSVRLGGRDLIGLSEREMQKVRGDEVAMIFQDPMTSLNPTWTIGRQIAEAVLLHREVSAEAARERSLEVLSLVGMPRPEERLDSYPHQLSGGLRQRVMIAIALACDPKLLIADEPTTALDVTIQAQILDLIDDLRTRLHMGVVLITHDLGVIAARASRVMVMYAGKIVETATTTELFSAMRHPYSEALLESIPRLDQDRSKPLQSIAGLPPDLSLDLTGCRFAPRCRFADERCRQHEPPLGGDLGDIAASHRYACYHPRPAAHGRVATEGDRRAPVDAPPDSIQPDATTPVGGEPPAVQPAASAVAATSADRLGDDRLGHTELSARPKLVVVEQLVKEYPVTAGAIVTRRLGLLHAVSDVSFTIHEGETFGLVGESGCGKTTIGRMLTSLERPTSGTVTFDGVRIDQLSGRALRRRRRDLQLMFQDPYSSLDPRMRVGTILREPLVIQHLGSHADQVRRVGELLDEVGLSRRAAQLYPHEFSGGQRQRIGLARALALNPRLVIADEPVSALDVSIQAQILNLMRSLQERHGLTLVVISHDLAVVKYIADTIGVMYLGKLVEVGPSEEIYAAPAHPYTRGLIDAIPVPNPQLAAERRRRVISGELPSALNPPTGCRFHTRCPFAAEICAAEEPLLRPFGPGHTAACHFPLVAPVGGPTTDLASAGV